LPDLSVSQLQTLFFARGFFLPWRWRRHVPPKCQFLRDGILHSHHYENLKSYLFLVIAILEKLNVYMENIVLYLIALFWFLLRFTLIILCNPEEIYLSNANESIISKSHTFAVRNKKLWKLNFTNIGSVSRKHNCGVCRSRRCIFIQRNSLKYRQTRWEVFWHGTCAYEERNLLRIQPLKFHVKSDEYKFKRFSCFMYYKIYI
jgi:hypothetical protein